MFLLDLEIIIFASNLLRLRRAHLIQYSYSAIILLGNIVELKSKYEERSAAVRVAVGRVNCAHNLVQNVNTLIMGSYIIAENEPEILTELTCPDTVQYV